VIHLADESLFVADKSYFCGGKQPPGYFRFDARLKGQIHRN
jgi:hypothetical protein